MSMSTNQILEAATLKFGRRFKTLREVGIYISRQEQPAEEVSPDDSFHLGFTAMKPKEYDDTANCVGEHSEELKNNNQYGIRTMLTMMETNQLWVKGHAAPSPVVILTKKEIKQWQKASVKH